LVLGAGVVAAVAVVVALRSNRAIEVSVATVARDTLTVTIPAEGRTRAREQFTVAAPITGRVTRLDVRPGDQVTEGQVLARLYPAPEDPRSVAAARAEVAAAEARVLDARARVVEAGTLADQARREVERRRPLLEIGALTREGLEQAELAARVAEERTRSAEAGVTAAQAALDAARARLLGTESAGTDVRPVDVVAPASGRVERVPDESERVVVAGSPLVVLGGIGGLEVVMDVLSEDAVQVEVGSHVVLDAWGGEGSLHAKVRTVTRVGYTEVSALGVEEQRVDIVADLRDPPSSLGTGYRVSGEIVIWQGEGVLQVPTSALFRMGDAWQLFVVEQRRARRRDVVLGRANERVAEVRDGLAEGETVIVFPPEGIDDGVRVETGP